MAKNKSSLNMIFSQKRWIGGISDYLKENPVPDSYYWSRCIDFRTDPQSITIMPTTIKESGTVVTDLLKWGDIIPTLSTSYFYGSNGNIYSRSSAGSWTNLHTVGSSHGNGLAYFQADDYLYYTSDSLFGRYGPISSSPQFSDDFLGSQGGTPQNTYSLSLTAASSMYATAADSASLSQTGDITLEAFFYANSLPTSGNTMTLIGKWDESGTTRSYIMDIKATSGYFGDGSDGALTISSNTTEAPIDSACTGTAGSTSLSATNASFAAGQIVLIHQTRGTNAGQWERNSISSYTAGTITLATALIGTYVSGAQVRVLKQHTNVTINSGITYTAKAWNGTVGGILGFIASGTVTVNGTITATGKGFRGGTGVSQRTAGNQGEGTAGAGSASISANGNGGGGGGIYTTTTYDASSSIGGGAGGGNSSSGTDGSTYNVGAGTALAGSSSGAADLTTMTFGGGGGSAGAGDNSDSSAGGNGGGILFITGATVTLGGSSSIVSAGSAGGVGTTGSQAGSGGGAGGSILIKAQTATLGTTLITAAGGSGGTAAGWATTANGGAGSTGRIHLDYYTSYTGTTSPTLDVLQDNNLVTNVTYQARIGISSTGNNSEYLTYPLTTLTTGSWNRLSISWASSTSTAKFYWNANLIGTTVGTLTAIHNNASLLYIASNKGASAVQNFFNGLMDDVRIWGNVQTATQILANNVRQLTATEAGIKAYYKLNNAATDATANANNLTLVNSPTYSTNVPFPDSGTRLDVDNSYTTGGSTYTLPTAISEAAADTLSFTPVNDPQKSVAFNVDTVGTGDFTVTVHDQQNRTIATKTIAAASVGSGWLEFIFSTPWRIVIGKTYHMHLTVSTGTSKVVSSTLDNFSTGNYYTYFGFLVTDTLFHPLISFLDFIAVGNERYVGKWDGAIYYPNFIALPVGWRVRCFAYWREYLAIGVWKGTTINAYDNGRVYFWDGIAEAFNFFIDVPEGQINAMMGKDSDLYIFAGYRGMLLDYQGGFFNTNGNSKSNKVKNIPKRGRADEIEIYPGAINYWRNLLHFGVGVNMSSSTVERGVYSWGSLTQNYPDALSFDYIPSTLNYGSTVSIGLVYPLGDVLVIGWQDGIAYGADMVSFDNSPYAQGTLECLVQDNQFIWKDKQIMTVRGDHLPLISGQSIDIAYKLDRATNYTYSSINSSTTEPASTFEELIVQNGRGNEYQIAIDLYTTTTTSPTVTGLSVLGDAGELEDQW